MFAPESDVRRMKEMRHREGGVRGVCSLQGKRRAGCVVLSDTLNQSSSETTALHIEFHAPDGQRVATCEHL